LDEEDAENSGINKTSFPISPAQSGNEATEYQSHENDTLNIIPVLPNNDSIIVQVGNIGTADAFRVLLQDNPAQMRVHNSIAHRIWVLVRIGMSIMCSMVSGPPPD
jgi:hypothetical protein